MEDCRIVASVHGRYLLQPAAGDAPARLLVGYHGYGETADAQWTRLRGIPGTSRWWLASIQALHPFYRGRSDQVVASWMTRFDRQHAIDDNVRYASAVLAEIDRRQPMRRRVHAGFSQGVAMAFRAALGTAHPADAVIALGGDVPPELGEHDPAAWRGLRVLLARGTHDEWYTAAKMAADVDLLRSRQVPVETFTFEGGHEWSPAFSDAAGRLLDAIAIESP
jgi:predicted esterase